MGIMKSFRTRFQGLTDTILRFPATILLLFSTAVINAVVISTKEFEDYPKLLFTFIVGASIYALSQVAFEHYHEGNPYRLLYVAISTAFTLAYFFIIRNSEITTIITIRTIVLLFVMLVAFLWIPSIRSAIDFNKSFMAVFKSFWISGFFSGILFLGIALILRAINILIVPISSISYAHAANIVFVLYAPLYFLSLIPKDPAVGEGSRSMERHQTEENSPWNGESEIIPAEDRSQENTIPEEKATKCKEDKAGKDSDSTSKLNTAGKAGDTPGILSSLLSYVIIPVTAIFTIILLIYIILNITDEFWKDSLLEPLLVSYSITVIIVYLLVSRLESPIAAVFRRIFPKILVPVVLFQTVSSCIRIGDAGITHGRYYVILFGFFATVAGLLFCFLPIRKNGLIAPILILLSLLSILPPVDAFTVSRNSQTGRLKSVLMENGMLTGNGITPNPDLNENDRKRITSSIDYLNQMNYTEDIPWLADYSSTYNFDQTFGFPRYGYTKGEYGSLYLYLDPESMINVAGYDYLRSVNISGDGNNQREAAFRKDGVDYTLEYDRSGVKTDLVLKSEETELIRFSVNEIIDRFNTSEQVNHSAELSEEEAKFTVENEQAVLTLTVQIININYWQEGSNWYADAFILIRIK